MAMSGLWRSFLTSPCLQLRLGALREVAGLGAEGAEALLARPPLAEGELRFPWLWALCQCAEPPLLRGRNSVPAAMARLLMRRGRRRTVGLSRTEFLERMREAWHPLGQLAWAMRLLESHGDRATPALLESLRAGGSEELQECTAWALGKLGRAAVPEMAQEYGGASRRVRSLLALAFWFMGPAADRAATVLVGDQDPMASAALLAMEGAASRACVAARRTPVWLDRAAVQDLAQLAFSDQDRDYAALALGGYGPAWESTLPILRHLARDPEARVRQRLCQGLAWGGRRETRPILWELYQDVEPSVAEQARATWQAMEAIQPLTGEEVMACLQAGTSQRQSLCQQLAIGGLKPGPVAALLLEDTDLGVVALTLEALLEGGEAPTPHLARLLQLAQEGFVDRVAPLLARLEDPTLLAFWHQQLRAANREVGRLAVEAVQRLPGPLPDLRTVHPTLLPELLASLAPQRLQPSDIEVFLTIQPNWVRKAAIDALARYGQVPEPILQAVEERLEDPSASVAVAASHFFLQRGHRAGAWGLLRSPEPGFRHRGLKELQGQALPEGLLRSFRAGQFDDPEVLQVLRQHLSPEEMIRLAFDSPLRPGTALWEKVAEEVAKAGVGALDQVPACLAGGDPWKANLALLVLEKVLQGKSESSGEWVRQNWRSLPLEGEWGLRLQSALSEALSAEEEPAWLEFWDGLLESPDALLACRALQILTPARDAADLLVRALGHPQKQVRAMGLQLLGAQLSGQAWEKVAAACREAPERNLLAAVGQWCRGELEEEDLAGALCAQESLGWDSMVLFPIASDAQFCHFLDLLAAQPGSSSIQRSLAECRISKLSKVSWGRLKGLLGKEVHPGFLLRRWPRLVITALLDPRLGPNWVKSQGEAAREGLHLALKRPGLTLRRLARNALAWLN